MIKKNTLFCYTCALLTAGGNTALILASEAGHAVIVQLLLKANAQVDVQRDGNVALDHSKMFGKTSLSDKGSKEAAAKVRILSFASF